MVQQPNGVRSACVYDGTQCVFNPYSVDSPNFPLPEQSAETMLKTFALQSFTCRNATETADCHLDPLCDWDGRTGACYLALDPHSDFTGTVFPCKDLLYSPVSESCWRRVPQPVTHLPCGDPSCKLYPKGSGAANATTSSTSAGAGAGTPEDRCMLAAEVRHLGPADVYELLRLRYGAEQGTLPGGGGGGELRAVGFGSCATAGLHHTLATRCRTGQREACRADASCAVTVIVAHEFCVPSRETVVQALLGNSAFTRTVLQTDRACAAASGSRDECLAVGLVTPARRVRRRR